MKKVYDNLIIINLYRFLALVTQKVMSCKTYPVEKKMTVVFQLGSL